MSDQAAAERAELEKRDKSELMAIVDALGGKASTRSKKADLVDQILQLSGVLSDDDPGADDSAADAGSSDSSESDSPAAGSGGAEDNDETGGQSDTVASQVASSGSTDDSSAGTRGSRRRRGRRDEPPAEWELHVEAEGEAQQSGGGSGSGRGQGNRGDNDQKQDDQKQGSQKQGSQKQGAQKQGSNDKGQGGQNQGDKDQAGQNQGDKDQGDKDQSGQSQGDKDQGDDDGESGNRRRRRRGRGRDRDENVEPANTEPIAVEGYLDLRDDGYGFIRVNGHLPTKDDVYVPVKLARQHGLRKGDLVAGSARAATRNEKNPALHELATINGEAPEASEGRPDFESLTPLFPDERLRLERTNQPLDLTPRIIDLITPIGKGQRGLIVSPPKAGKTTIMKELAASIEHNHPEVALIVLLVDERPEEVTDMKRHLKAGEVVASTFDRPVEEHCAIAELTLERSKRMVEQGKDVVIILDGITRLARAYNMAASGTGRVMSGGVDAGALYPPKKFLGAARNLEEGGSLTILATALVETGSRMDEVIFEEFKGTGNMELRLDRGLAEHMIFPAIDPLGSSTRRSELLADGPEHHAQTKLRKVLAGLAGGDDGAAAAGMNLLMDRLRSFRTNAEFLKEIAKAP